MKDLAVDSSSQLDGAGKLPEVKTKADDANIGNADQIIERTEKHVIDDDKQSKEIDQKEADTANLPHQKSQDQIESKTVEQNEKASTKKLKAKVVGSKKKPRRKQGDQEVIHNWDTSPGDFGGEDDDMAPPYPEDDEPSMDDDNTDEDSLHSDKSDHFDADPPLDDVDSHSDDNLQQSDNDDVDPHSDDIGSANDDDVMGHDDTEHGGGEEDDEDDEDDRVGRMHAHLKSEIKQLQGDEKYANSVLFE